MWTQFKQAGAQIYDLITNTPFSDSTPQKRAVYEEQVKWFLEDLHESCGELPTILRWRWNEIHRSGFIYEHKDMSQYPENDRAFYSVYFAERDWFLDIMAWVEMGFEHGRFPIYRGVIPQLAKEEPKYEKKSQMSQSKWSLETNGKQAVLHIGNTTIDLSFSVKRKGLALILCQMLAWPGITDIYEHDFEEQVRFRNGILDVASGEYKQGAFADTVRHLNKKISTEAKLEEDFLILTTESACRVNEKYR